MVVGGKDGDGMGFSGMCVVMGGMGCIRGLEAAAARGKVAPSVTNPGPPPPTPTPTLAKRRESQKASCRGRGRGGPREVAGGTRQAARVRSKACRPGRERGRAGCFACPLAGGRLACVPSSNVS